MKILVVSPHYYPEAFSLTGICEGFASKGNQVTVITGQPCYGEDHIYAGYEQTGEDYHNGVRIIRLKTKPRTRKKLSIIGNYLSFWLSSKSFIRHFKEDYDVVYSMVLSPITAASAANDYARKHHIKHVHDCLDLWPESVVAAGEAKKTGLFYRLCYHLSRNIYRKMNSIIVSSPSFESYFRQVLKLPDVPITYIPQPSLLQENRQMAPIKYSAGFNVVYAGNIGRLQMVDQIVEACNQFSDDSEFCFHVVGSGSQLQTFLKKVEELHLEKTVVYEGRIPSDQVWRYYENADVLIGALVDDGTYVSKTVPNKLVTYMAYGKPIIFASSGDAAVISKETGGCLSPRPTVESIGQALHQLRFLDSMGLAKMGQANAAFYASHYSPSFLIDQRLSILKRTAASK